MATTRYTARNGVVFATVERHQVPIAITPSPELGDGVAKALNISAPDQVPTWEQALHDDLAEGMSLGMIED